MKEKTSHFVFLVFALHILSGKTFARVGTCAADICARDICACGQLESHSLHILSGKEKENHISAIDAAFVLKLAKNTKLFFLGQ